MCRIVLSLDVYRGTFGRSGLRCSCFGILIWCEGAALAGSEEDVPVHHVLGKPSRCGVQDDAVRLFGTHLLPGRTFITFSFRTIA